MSQEWFYASDGKQFGPVSLAELAALAQSGQLLSTDMVWKQGMAQWAPVSTLKGAFNQPESRPMPQPPSSTHAGARVGASTSGPASPKYPVEKDRNDRPKRKAPRDAPSVSNSTSFSPTAPWGTILVCIAMVVVFTAWLIWFVSSREQFPGPGAEIADAAKIADEAKEPTVPSNKKPDPFLIDKKPTDADKPPLDANAKQAPKAAATPQAEPGKSKTDKLEKDTGVGKPLKEIKESILPLETLTLWGEFSPMALSPDGSRLATVTRGEGGWLNVTVWDAVTGRKLVTFSPGSLKHVGSFSFSPDAQRLACAFNSGLFKPYSAIRVWDTATGKQLREFMHDPGTPTPIGFATHRIASVTFSADGHRLAASHRNTVKVWQASTGKELVTRRGHTDTVNSVAFSPDGGRLASGSNDKTVKIWDTDTWQEIRTLHGHTGPISSVVFSPDGARLASDSYDGCVKVWDAATGKELRSLPGQTLKGVDASGDPTPNRGKRVSFSPDGRWLATANDGTIKVWEVATWENIFILPSSGTVDNVSFSRHTPRLASFSRPVNSPDEIVLFDSRPNKMQLWDFGTALEVVTLRGPPYPVHSVFLSPDGRVLGSSTANPQSVKVWDATNGKEVVSVSLLGHKEPIHRIAVSPDGSRLATASEDRTVMLWDAATGKELRTLRGHIDYVTTVSFSSDGRHLASGSHDKTVKIWEAGTGMELHTLHGHTGNVTRLTFSHDGSRVASASEDNSVKIWDAATGKQIRTLRYGAVDVLSLSRDGRRLACGMNHSHGFPPRLMRVIKVCDVGMGKELFTLVGHSNKVTSVTFSPDGNRLTSASDDSTIKLYRADTGKEVLTLRGHKGAVYCVAFSADGNRLISTGSDNAVKIWDITGK